MSKVLIMTDSAAGLPPEVAKEHNTRIVPVGQILFKGKTYYDGMTITPAEAYAFLKKDENNFTTAAVPPGFMLDLYRDAVKTSDRIFFITISGALSTAPKTAALAAEMLQKENPAATVRVFDSTTVAGSEGLMAIAMAKAAAVGADLDALSAFSGKARQVTGGVMMLDTLRYIYRTGRMSKTKSRLISMLNIRPVNRINEAGEVEFVDRARNREAGMQKMIEAIKKEAKTDSLHFMVLHADAPELGQALSEKLRAEFNCLSLTQGEYSPVMGYGAGPKCLYAGFHPELPSM